MLYTLKNDQLTVRISDHGAELSSVRRGDCEYIWQADAAFWNRHAPLMFPICGRLFENRYTYGGKDYKMNQHGFLRDSDMNNVEQVSDTDIRFFLHSDAKTAELYPFSFELIVHYTLEGDKLNVEMTVKNEGDAELPATFGWHPAFNVPLAGAGKLEDYYLEFAEDCAPSHLLFSETCFQTGKKTARKLENARVMRLSREMFDHDAVFMDRVADTVTLKSDKAANSVTLHYPDMPYLGVWQKPHSEAPFVCVEPFCGLPAFDGEVDDLAAKPDLFRVPAGRSKTVRFDATFR